MKGKSVTNPVTWDIHTLVISVKTKKNQL